MYTNRRNDYYFCYQATPKRYMMKTTFTSSAAQLPRILTCGGIVFLLMGLFLSGSVQADILVLKQSQPSGHDWSTVSDFDNVASCTGGYRVVNNGRVIRTPQANSNPSITAIYLGYTYDVATGTYTVVGEEARSQMGLKNQGANTITIENLYLGNGQVLAWGVEKPTLAGKIFVEGARSEINAQDALTFYISSQIVKVTPDACLDLVPYDKSGVQGEIWVRNSSNVNCPLNMSKGTLVVDGENTFGSDFGLTLQDGTGIILGGNFVGKEGTTITVNGSVRYGHWQNTSANKVCYSNLIVPEGSTLNANNNYDIGAKGSMVFVGDLQGAGALVVDTVGSANTNRLTLGHPENSFTGTVSVNSGKLQFTVLGFDGVTYTGTNALINAASVTVASGATIDVGATTQTFNNLSGAGTITISEGGALTLNNNQTTLFTGSISGSGKGTLTKTGEGTLLINAAQNAVDVHSLVVSSGRLDMKSYFKGDLEINNSATFSPGNSIGKLEQTGNFTLDSGATLLMEIGGTDAELNDQLIVSGNFDFANGAIIELVLADNAALNPGDTFTAILSGSNSSDFEDTLIDNFVRSYFFTDLAYVPYGNGYAITGRLDPNAVPEPSTWALLALGAAGLLYWRKRK